jgi:cell division protein FtsB
MKRFAKVWPWLKNKYVLTIIAFLVWMAFFDRNDVISQYRYKKELHELQDEKAYYEAEIARSNAKLLELTSDPNTREKFAREQYKMKKDDEEIFQIIREEPKDDKSHTS